MDARPNTFCRLALCESLQVLEIPGIEMGQECSGDFPVPLPSEDTPEKFSEEHQAESQSRIGIGPWTPPASASSADRENDLLIGLPWKI